MLRNKKQSINRYTLFLFLIPLFFLCYTPDNDLWFLFSCGKHVLHNGFPTVEPFSFHEDFAYVMQQWLFAVGSYLSFSHFGMFFLYLGMSFCLFLIGFVLYRTAMMITDNNNWVSSVSVFLTMLTMAMNMTTRPLTITMLLLAIVLYIMEKYTKTKKITWLLWLFPISVLGVNLQAAMWLMPFLFIVPYGIECFFCVFIQKEPRKKELLDLSLGALIYLVGGFLNPYGIQSMTYVFGSYGVATINETIKEMQAPSIVDIYARFTMLYVLLTLILLVVRRQTPVRLAHVLLALGCMYLAFSTYRSIPLLLVVLPVMVSHQCKDMTFRSLSVSKWEQRIVLVLVSALLACAVYVPWQRSTLSPYPEEYDLLHSFAESMEEEELAKVRLFIGFNQGGCAAYCDIPMYIDPRAEVYTKNSNKKQDIFDEFYDYRTGAVSFHDLVKKHRITHIYGSPEDIAVVYAKTHPDYTLIAEDEYGKLFQVNASF